MAVALTQLEMCVLSRTSRGQHPVCPLLAEIARQTVTDVPRQAS